MDRANQAIDHQERRLAAKNNFQEATKAMESLRLAASGFQFTEGPVWIPRGSGSPFGDSDAGRLLFNDIPEGRTYSWSETGCRLLRENNGNANGNTLNRQGELISCEHGGRRVVRLARDGNLHVVASEYLEQRLNSPNDVVVHSDGSIWFTDPPYGVAPEERNLDFQGVFRAIESGEVRLISKDLVKPNGLAFALDESSLFVADTERGVVEILHLSPGHEVERSSTFCRVRRPDGIRLDSSGNVWIATLDGIEVFRPDGSRIGGQALPERPANLEFGGPDGRTLFICARSSLYCLRTSCPGASFRKTSTDD